MFLKVGKPSGSKIGFVLIPDPIDVDVSGLNKRLDDAKMVVIDGDEKRRIIVAELRHRPTGLQQNPQHFPAIL